MQGEYKLRRGCHESSSSTQQQHRGGAAGRGAESGWAVVEGLPLFCKNLKELGRTRLRRRSQLILGTAVRGTVELSGSIWRFRPRLAFSSTPRRLNWNGPTSPLRAAASFPPLVSHIPARYPSPARTMSSASAGATTPRRVEMLWQLL